MHLKARHGLSPIVSIIFLILIAVASIVIVFSWFSGTASQNPTTEPALRQMLRINGVHVYDDGSYYDITIYVMNAGSENIIVSGAYIESASNQSILAVNNTRVTIAPGTTGFITIQDAFPNTVEGLFIAKIVSDNGVEALQTFTIPPS